MGVWRVAIRATDSSLPPTSASVGPRRVEEQTPGNTDDEEDEDEDQVEGQGGRRSTARGGGRSAESMWKSYSCLSNSKITARWGAFCLVTRPRYYENRNPQRQQRNDRDPT